MNGRKHLITTPRMTRMPRMLSRCTHGSGSRAFSASTERSSYSIRREGGFSLVVALVMVALMAVIAVGVMTTVSLERGTATSYSSRYKADLAAQNGLQAASKTLAASPNGTNSVTGKDTFLIVRADGPAQNGITPTYHYLAQPSTGPNPTITYYPLFSASTNPGDPGVIQTQTINLAAPAAPAVP